MQTWCYSRLFVVFLLHTCSLKLILKGTIAFCNVSLHLTVQPSGLGHYCCEDDLSACSSCGAINGAVIPVTPSGAKEGSCYICGLEPTMSQKHMRRFRWGVRKQWQVCPNLQHQDKNKGNRNNRHMLYLKKPQYITITEVFHLTEFYSFIFPT